MTSNDSGARTAAIIPAYQSAGSVGDIVGRTLPLVSRVIVVDDGSTDGTGDVARRAGAELIVHPKNRGKGAALQTAFGACFQKGTKQVVTLDSDGQHLPEEIPKLLDAAAQGADLVLGTRDSLFSEMSRLRRCANQISSRLISIVAGKRISDIQTGFRLYTGRLLDATGFPESGFEAESTIVVRAVRKGFDVVCVPVELGFVDGRKTSHFRPVVDSIRIGRAVIRARFEGK